MDARRAQRLLLIAFAISLLLHLVLALVARISRPVEHVQQQVVSLDARRHPVVIMHRIPIVAHTPPPPPKALPSSAPAQRTPPKNISRDGTRAAGIGAAPKPAAIATPTPLAAIACTGKDTPAGVQTEPTPADIPLDARAQHTSGITSVLVKLDEKGAVVSAVVQQSSGNTELDVVAVTDARNAQYAPAYHDCKPVAGQYTFRRSFVPF